MVDLSAKIGSIAKTDQEDSPALLELPIVFVVIDFHPERVSSYREKEP